MKNLISVLFLAFALFASSCSKSDDPTPTPTNLETVKASLVGTWAFQSVTVTQGSKTATTSTCAKTELTNAAFTDTNWQSITPEPTLKYSGTNSVNYSTVACSGGAADLTWTAIENVDKTVTVTLSNTRVFIVNVADVTSSTIKALLVNDKGYTIKFEFKRL